MFSHLATTPKIDRHERIRLMHLQGLGTDASPEAAEGTFMEVLSPGVSQFIDSYDAEDGVPTSAIIIMHSAASESFQLSTPIPMSPRASFEFDLGHSQPSRQPITPSTKRRRRHGQFFLRTSVSSLESLESLDSFPGSSLESSDSETEESDDGELHMPTFPISPTPTDMSMNDDIYSNFDDPAIDDIEFEILTHPPFYIHDHLNPMPAQPLKSVISDTPLPRYPSVLRLSRVPEAMASIQHIPHLSQPIVSPLSASFVFPTAASDVASSVPASPISPLPLSTAERRQKRMDKLTKTLGARPPSALIRTPVPNQTTFTLGHNRSASTGTAGTLDSEVRFDTRDIQPSFRFPLPSPLQEGQVWPRLNMPNRTRQGSSPLGRSQTTMKKGPSSSPARQTASATEKGQHRTKLSLPCLNLFGSAQAEESISEISPADKERRALDYRRRKEAGWSGEWNAPIQDVMRELRTLKAQ